MYMCTRTNMYVHVHVATIHVHGYMYVHVHVATIQPSFFSKIILHVTGPHLLFTEVNHQGVSQVVQNIS